MRRLDTYCGAGVSVESAWPGLPFNNGTKIMSGTSAAAPLIAGQALLVVAAVPGITAGRTREVIEQSASRGTILGSHIDPDAEGSRVPRVPWLEASSELIYKVGHGHPPIRSNGKFSNNDTVLTTLETKSRTNPAMQYMVNFVANDLYGSLADRLDQLEISDFQIECRDVSSRLPGRLFGYRQRRSGNRSTRGWDLQPKAAIETQTAKMTIACNMTCSAGKGNALKREFLASMAAEMVKGAFGDKVETRSDPVLMSAIPLSARASSSRKWLIVACLCVSFAIASISVIICRCYQRKKNGNY